MKKRTTSGSYCFNTSRMVKKLPSDLDIFSPSTRDKAVVQPVFDVAGNALPVVGLRVVMAAGMPRRADALGNFCFHGAGTANPRRRHECRKYRRTGFSLMAEHSMCQPGRPLPHGLSHAGSPAFSPLSTTQNQVDRV